MKGKLALVLMLLSLVAFSIVASCSHPFFDERLMAHPEDEPSALKLAAPGISAPEEEWNKTFGGSDYDEGYFVQQTSDGGYVVAGRTWYNGNGNVWLIKTDPSGNEMWNKTFGGTDYEEGRSVQETCDGGYIISGATLSYGAGYWDAWLIKTDSAGNEMWNRTFGGTNRDFSYSVQQTSDNGYVVAGITGPESDVDVWLIKTNPTGIETWNKTFNRGCYDVGCSVQQTSDNGYVVAGTTLSLTGGDPHTNVWLIKTDSSGNEMWNKVLGGTFTDVGTSVQQTVDGGYIITGGSDSYSDPYGVVVYDVWLIKTDSSGNEMWNKTFGGSNGGEGSSVRQTVDGGYIITGHKSDYCEDVWLIKTNSAGNEMWNKTFRATDTSRGYSVQQTSDGGYIIAGSIYIDAAKGDVWLIKVGPETTSFDYPVGTPRSQCGTGYVTQENDGDGWYNAQDWRVYNEDYGGYHPGEDWNGEGGGTSDVGAPVYVVADGVVNATTSNVAGGGIAIEHKLPNGDSIYSVYIHICVNTSLNVGSVVHQGEQIGTIADITPHGMSPHLHFEMRTKPVNPLDWYPNDLGNGYYNISLLDADGLTVDPSDFIDSNRGEVVPPLYIEGYKLDVSTGEYLEGWRIILNDDSGNEIANTTTNSTGHYQFCNLVPGDYEVCEEVKEGWTSVAATCFNVTLVNDKIGVAFLNKPESLAVDVDEAASDTWIDLYSSNADDKEAVIWYEIEPDDFSGKLYMEIQDLKGNVYTWDEGLISVTGGRHSLVWDGRVDNEFVNQPNNPYYISLILQKDGQEVARSANHEIWVGRPVILLHGLFSSKENMEDTVLYDDLGTSFYVSSVEYDGGIIGSSTGDIRRYARKLNDEIEVIKRDTGAKKVDIVAHSMGGLVARWYIQKLGKGDVGKLIMIGTPNHGADIANLPKAASKTLVNIISSKLGLSELGYSAELLIDELTSNFAINEMIPHHPFLQELNNNDGCAYYIEKGVNYEDEISESCRYAVISSKHWFPTLTHNHISVNIFGVNSPPIKVFSSTSGDGIVPLYSAKLSGVSIWSESDSFHVGEQTKSQDIIDEVRSLLQQPDELIQYNPGLYEEDVLDSDSNPAYWTNPIEDLIHPGEVKCYNITVDPSSTESHFLVVWDNGTLNATLSAPNGTEIEIPSEGIYAAYSVLAPDSGNWTIEISPTNIPPNGTNVTIQAFIENPLFIGVHTDKTVFDPQEPIKITAYLGNNESGLANAFVMANISKPDNTTETLTLYDDGLHNDNQTADGIYANEYTNTSLWGTYHILISASGNVNGDDFERETFTTVWIELYPDLTLESSDIYLSNNAPGVGENVTISATIHNIGDANANNSSIMFYDGDPANGELIGEDLINISSGGSAIASTPWITKAGVHKIFIQISPFNEFLESSYANNVASNVYCINVLGCPHRMGRYSRAATQITLHRT